MNVVGALMIKKTDPIKNNYMRKNCFEVSDQVDKWMLCGCNEKIDHWVEIIRKNLVPLNLSSTNESISENTTQNNEIQPVVF